VHFRGQHLKLPIVFKNAEKNEAKIGIFTQNRLTKSILFFDVTLKTITDT